MLYILTNKESAMLKGDHKLIAQLGKLRAVK
jgi:hypothetical protein